MEKKTIHKIWGSGIIIPDLEQICKPSEVLFKPDRIGVIGRNISAGSISGGCFHKPAIYDICDKTDLSIEDI